MVMVTTNIMQHEIHVLFRRSLTHEFRFDLGYVEYISIDDFFCVTEYRKMMFLSTSVLLREVPGAT